MYKYKLITEKKIKTTELIKLVEKYNGFISGEADERYMRPEKINRLEHIKEIFEKIPNQVITVQYLLDYFRNTQYNISYRTASRDIVYLGQNTSLFYDTYRDKKGTSRGYLAKNKAMLKTIIKLQDD